MELLASLQRQWSSLLHLSLITYLVTRLKT
nr:MAG TPA_asm: hypothetical protein [Caudoviricetes sp.]